MIHRGRKFSFVLLASRGADGVERIREIVRHPGAAVILPVLSDGAQDAIVFIRNHRPAIGRSLLELPAGTLEPGEPPEVCAARELEEETGYRAGTLVKLGEFYSAPGFADELLHAFLATDLDHVGARPEADEQIEPVVIPVSRVPDLLRSGGLTDAKSISSISLASVRGLLRLPG